MDPDENIFDGTLSTNICSLDCRSVRVGSYKVRPKDRILVAEKGVQIQVPAINNMEIVTIAIPMTDVLKVLANFKKSMPIFFLYLSPGACKKARASLSMNSKQSFFVDITSADETQKRLTILPEKLSDESKIQLKRHFGSTLLEITSNEANEILVKSNPKYHHVFKQTMQNKVKANGSDIQKEMAPPFNWPLRLKQIDDNTDHLHIPSDITFKIQEDGVTHKVEAHKMVLAKVSPVFHWMLFVHLERGDKEVHVEGTTPAAFKTMKNAIYNVVSMEKSLEGKSATEVFAVLELVKRYQIRELKKIVLDHLDSFSLTDDTVLEVASAAMKRSQSSEFGGPRLFLRCAKFLRPKFADAQAVFQYLADYKEQKEVIHELLVVMKDLGPSADGMKDLDPCTDTVEEIKHVMDTTDTEDENLAAAIKASLDNAEMKHVMDTTNTEDENLAAAIKASLDNVPAKQNIKTVKRKIVGDNTTRARAEANKINIMDMSEDDLSEGETIIRINKRRTRSGKFVNPKRLELSNRGINMVHASTLKSEKSNKWSAGGGKVEKAQHDLKEDVKNEEDSDEKMNKPPAKKAKTSWSKSSTSTRYIICGSFESV